jgi:hypothetical protein
MCLDINFLPDCMPWLLQIHANASCIVSYLDPGTI